MYQTIVLSPTFLKFLEKGNPIRREARGLLDQLETETIILDTNGALRQEYAAVIEQSPKAEQLKWVFASLMSVVKRKRLQKDLTPRSISELENLENEAVLAAETSWRIIVVGSCSQSIELNLAHRGIEVANITHYLHPASLSRIRALEKYELKSGDRFDFRKWILKFLADAKSFEIADGYICTPDALEDLKYILQNVRDFGIPVHILTLSDTARDRSRNQATISTDTIKVLSELNALKGLYPELKISWEICKDKKNLRDRWIKTDRFKIELSHGLGFINSETNEVVGQTTITVQAIS